MCTCIIKSLPKLENNDGDESWYLEERIFFDLRALIVLSLGKQNLHLPHFVSCVDNLRNICASNNVS